MVDNDFVRIFKEIRLFLFNIFTSKMRLLCLNVTSQGKLNDALFFQFVRF